MQMNLLITIWIVGIGVSMFLYYWKSIKHLMFTKQDVMEMPIVLVGLALWPLILIYILWVKAIGK
jgi:hypothetical protein